MKTQHAMIFPLQGYVRPLAECIDLHSEGALMGFSQGQPIVTPSSANRYDYDDYDEE